MRGAAGVGSDQQVPRPGPDRARPRRLWPYVLGLVVVIAVYGAISAVQLLRTATRMESGFVAIHQARAELTLEDLTAGRANADVASGAGDFTIASRTVNSAWLTPYTVLPYFGRQLRSLRALATAAAAVTTATRDALPGVQSILSAPHATAGQRAALLARLATTTATLGRKVSSISLGPSQSLVGTLAAKRAAFQVDLDRFRAGLDRATSATTAASKLLRGPGTYLVLASNNSEMRSGSGMFLQAGTITFHEGVIGVGSFASTGDLSADQPAVPISGDLQARWGQQQPNQEWRNLGLSPQFPLNAPVAAAMWQAGSGQQVAGVIEVDVAALADILRVTGPVTIDGITYTADSAEEQILVDQYQGLGFNDVQNASRHDRLGLLAAGALGALQGPGLSVSSLTQALDDASNGRHLMIWDAQPATEAEWQSAGVGGSVAPEGLLVGLMNQGANKIDPFQTLDGTISTQPDGADTAVTVSITVHNEAPGSLSRYAGDGTPGPRLVYNGCLALDLPAYAGRITHQGGGAVESEGRDGQSDVVAVAVVVPRRGVTTVSWHFMLLGRHGSLVVEPSARIPAIAWTASSVGPAPAPSSSVKPLIRAFSDQIAHNVVW